MAEKRYLLGVMQGRLVPKYKDQYQAHPVGYWEDEFSIAAELGLDTIEFILDRDEMEKNPLSTPLGVRSIQKVAGETGVRVKSICADYFMKCPLFAADGTENKDSVLVLKNLMNAAAELSVTDIVIPCVDESTLDSDMKKSALQNALKSLYPLADRLGINLALETDLPPFPFSQLLNNFGPRVTVNYDVGNSAALGYHPEEELATYGNRISDIHIKDRHLGGGSTLLGSGSAQFEKFFSALRKINFQGHFIMQAYRDEEGLDVFKRQLEWVKPKLEDWVRNS